jgi:hypothetical protein
VLRFNPFYDLSKEAANDFAFLGGIDDEIDINNDNANKIARDLWLDILSDSSGDSSSIVTFSQYMDLLQSQSTGFIYEFATDKNGYVYGVVWQTATMRSSFERYGGYIALDTMKRDTSCNNLRTPSTRLWRLAGPLRSCCWCPLCVAAASLGWQCPHQTHLGTHNPSQRAILPTPTLPGQLGGLPPRAASPRC